MSQPSHGHGFSTYAKLLFVLFLLTLPLVNPWVRGDGVGYYAYVRSLLIDHNLRFEEEWRAGNSTFVMGRVDEGGHLKADQYARTGYVANIWAVGPSLLWAPFLVMIHLVVLGLNKLGAHIPADGYSRPYLLTMAMATATYAFAGLYLAFRLAGKYFGERWAFLGTFGIWFGTSLPVYMYFNPSWSHAHSAFAVSLFLWYWHRTRGWRTAGQWATLGLCTGLMLNIYYANAVLLLLPALEALANYARAWRLPEHGWSVLRRLFLSHVLYIGAMVSAFLPTLITRQIIFGSPLEFGYAGLQDWAWTSPALGSVLFSSNHGLLSWTPILGLALLGLPLLWRVDKELTTYLVVAVLGFYYLIASHLYWHGMSSFGNRFFVSLTPIFVLGLTASFASFAQLFERIGRAFATASLATGLFVLWNLGFIFQWGTHMIPVRGPISWRQMTHNQVAAVPARLTNNLINYLLRRKVMMEHIEEEDLEQLQSGTPKGN